MSLLQADLTLVLISTVNIFIAELLFKDVQAFVLKKVNNYGFQKIEGVNLMNFKIFRGLK